MQLQEKAGTKRLRVLVVSWLSYALWETKSHKLGFLFVCLFKKYNHKTE